MPSDSIFSGAFNFPVEWWVGTFLWFLVLILGDLYLNRKAKNAFTLKQAVVRSLVWISLGVLLGVAIWLNFGAEAGGRYFAGFLIEKSLSADNIFVWGVILTYFAVPKKYHYRVLLWGILGAIVFRSVFVIGGLQLIEVFEPTLLVMGAGLLYLSYKLMTGGDDPSFNPETSRIVKFVRKILSLSTKDHDGKLFAFEGRKLVATMLLLTIWVIELTDILFAIDSIPAAIAVVRDPYLVLASNIAAVLGLRALYFVYESIEGKFYLLNQGLALILFMVGVSLVLEPKTLFGLPWLGLEVPAVASVCFVVVVLTGAIVGSLLWPKPKKPAKVKAQ